ncbi:MAG: hypothetical protein J7559_23275, partial [Cohnella sp.]|nr:hypothetical protein [Cohnella sp.]
MVYGIATSPALIEEYHKWCVHGGLVSLYKVPLSERAILEGFGFDRVAYAGALFGGNDEGLDGLRQELSRIRDEFEPDVVICFTENAPIAQIFADRTIL